MNGHVGYRYYDVNHTAGRVLGYQIAEYKNTNYTEARGETLVGEFPRDAQILWEAKKDSCAQMEVQSATLGQTLGAPAIGDPKGMVLVEFTTGDAYDPNNVTDLIVSLGAYSNPDDAPGC